VVNAKGGAYLCHRCGWRGGWRSGSQTRPIRAEAPRHHLTLASHWRELWRSLSSITPGTTAHAYLVARGCGIPPADSDLRCTESLRHPSGHAGPALVALVTHAETREPMTLHRTWITADGKKANVDPPRLLLGKHRKQGGTIRLWPDEAVTTGLAVGEGIESTLTLAKMYRPAWSMIDANNMAGLPVLPGVEALVIAADHDLAGLRAAEQCAKRWYDAGRQVRILKSRVPGEDLNDCARRAA
jgi:hypothetical protein